MIWVLILSPMSGFACEGDHVGEAGAFGDDDGRGEVVGVGVFVGDVFDEEHEEDVVFVLTGVHAAAEFIAGGPEGGVEVGFFDGHGLEGGLREGVGRQSRRWGSAAAGSGSSGEVVV